LRYPTTNNTKKIKGVIGPIILKKKRRAVTAVKIIPKMKNFFLMVVGYCFIAIRPFFSKAPLGSLKLLILLRFTKISFIIEGLLKQTPLLIYNQPLLVIV
jgi:hypothetical protein